MGNMKSIYLRNLADDFWKKKKGIGVFIIICAVLFAALGARQAGKARELTEEQQEEVDTYLERLQEYDDGMADIEESLKLVNQQIDELQKYVDQSIYMKLDSQNIQVASVQYGLQTEANTGNILNALVLYINEGGLKEALSEEFKDLAVENWREIITPSITANLLNITVIHHDAQQAQRILDVVKTRVQEQVPQIAGVQGQFTLKEIDTANYVKADVGVLNTQNNNLNNLKNFTTNRVDLENRRISQQTNKENYIEKNEPEVLEVHQPGKTVQMAAYMILGILFGIVLPALLFILQYLLSNRIRSKEDLQHANMNVIGTYSAKNGYQPALDRCMMDIRMLAGRQDFSAVFLNAAGEDEITRQVTSAYEKAIRDAGYQAHTGFSVYERAEELKQMMECKNCLLFAQAGKTTYQQLEQQIELCRRFQVMILGCVMIQ